MNIGELAERTGLTHSRIRFYESAGLLTAVDRRPNGYRTYTPAAVTALDLITTAQKAGFTLDEIRKLLPSNLEKWEHGELVEALRRKVADIEKLEARLRQSRQQLVALLEDIESKPDDIDCAANARRVLSRVLGAEIRKPTMAADDVKLLGKAIRRRSAGR
jgi:DNA-binding transcriptional MerR regulator